MNSTRSYLDSMNAGRRRRSGTSLEQLSQTLDDLESRIRRPYDERYAAAEPNNRERRMFGRDRATDAREAESARQAQDSRAGFGVLAAELADLRGELRHQMGTGLHRELSALRSDIERAMSSTAPVNQVHELGSQFERLTGLVQGLASRGDDRQIEMLRQEMSEVKSALGKLAREDTLQAYDRRWEQLDPRDLTSRLEQIAGAIGTLPTSVALRDMEDQVKVLASAVDKVAHQHERVSPAILEALEERLDEISRAVAASATPARAGSLDPEPFERIEARIASLSKIVSEATETNAIDGLSRQLSSISTRVEDLARRVDVPDQTIDRLAEQIAAIASRLDTAPSDRELGKALSGLETRFGDLAQMLEHRHEDALASGQVLFRDLERRLNDVALTMNSTDGTGISPSTALIDALDARFADLAGRLERDRPDDAAMRDMQERIASISDRMDRSPSITGTDPELIRSLESQVAALAAQLAAPSSAAGELVVRLDKIEDAITASREDVMEAARMAAEEAVRRFSGSAGDRDLVAGLVDDLKSLETLARRSDDRNAKTFEAIHDTLLKIVERLGAVEAGRSSQATTMPRETGLSFASAPSLEPAMEAMPLEAPTLVDRPATTGAPQSPSRRSAAAAAAEAAADAVKEDIEASAGSHATGGRRSLLGGLARVLPGRKGKDGKAKVSTQEPVSEARRDPVLSGNDHIDPDYANKPLEPGSGAPDLNAIMKRVRDERGQPERGQQADAAKSDFIAAARRAAQAAAAEAEMMKRNPATKAKAGGLGGILKNRRKPVLMGIAAVLMALAALQAGKSFLSSGKEVARTAAPASVVAEAPVEAIQPVAMVPAEPAAAAPQVRMADTPRPAQETARELLTAVPSAPEEISTDWLETAATIPTLSADQASAELVEETLPQMDEDTLAAIPIEAGPVALREAAAAGDPKAYFEIANRYAEGRGVSEDMAEAAGWYEKAADAGLAPAQYRIGNLYEKGVGLERDVAKAKTWYQLAAAQGNASAMHNLAVLFAMGADGTTDNESAARWFLQAAELGVKDSQFNLGILAAKGVGTQQNLEEAYKWFALVAKTGDKDAAEKRDEIAKALRPEQLEKARAATELWRAKEVDAEANTVDVPDSWGESQDTTAGIDLKQALRDIQGILNKNGYDAGPADGVMGRRTQTAIAAFQADNGMTATGEVDEPLVRALLERR